MNNKRQMTGGTGVLGAKYERTVLGVSNKVLEVCGAWHSDAASIFLSEHTRTLLQASECFPRVVLLHFFKNDSSAFREWLLCSLTSKTTGLLEQDLKIVKFKLFNSF